MRWASTSCSIRCRTERRFFPFTARQPPGAIIPMLHSVAMAVEGRSERALMKVPRPANALVHQRFHFQQFD